jgi:hypothetical protein
MVLQAVSLKTESEFFRRSMTPVLDGKGEGKENIQYRTQSKIVAPEKLSAKEFSGIQQQCCTFTLSSNILLYSMCGGEEV